MQKTQLKIDLSRIELKWIKEYVTFLDQSVDRELKEIKVAAAKSDDEIYIEKLIEDHHMVGFHFSKHTMFTAYTLVHSHFERALSGIVSSIAEDRPTLIQPSDLKGEDSIARCKLYLKKVVGLELSSGQWSSIRPYIEVRNLLVHSLGQFHSEVPQKRRVTIEQLAKSGSTISVEDNCIAFGKPFVEEYISLIFGLFKELKSELSQWSKVRVVVA